LRGIRIQNIVNELSGEKIDVVQWSDDPRVFIANALSPAQVLNVTLNENETTALVKVPDKHLSLAIGKEGQNVRLAAKLTGWRIDIKSASELDAGKETHKVEAVETSTAPVAEAEEIPAAVETAEETVPSEETAELQPVAASVAAEETPGAAGIEILMPSEAVSPSQPSKIRFAEDIMAGREGKAKKKEVPKKDDGKDAGAKAKKTKHKKTVYYEDEDFES
jgi:N utilization substance protein A